ncbi:hypothetical protein BDZ97DRAFT_572314 [Flammula alnicola]|nr:hypothetical protein BDZ97DRAFT_572314 [Flammula alnicola]
MDSDLYLRDEAEEDGNEGYLLPLLPFHQILRRSRTIMDLREPDDTRTVDGIVSPYSGVFHSRVAPRRSAPQMRLQVSIPASATANTAEEITPQSDSPETPASVTSPIAGVVDLTRSVTTTSRYAVAQGGLSDIYMGEWHRAVDDAGVGEKITVAIKLLRVLASKDQDGVRARKVNFFLFI